MGESRGFTAPAEPLAQISTADVNTFPHDDGGYGLLAVNRRTCGSIARSEGRRPPGAVLHSPCEPGELRNRFAMTTAP